jgi:sarcosine oxidase subunit beta
MRTDYDAIIIGAGIIGDCIGFEMAKKGYKTLNVDKLSSAGEGSTANSCGIIRTHYSTWDGAALAYEGSFYWNAWEKYLGVEDESGLAKYINTGCLVFKTERNKYLKNVCHNLTDLEIEWEELTPDQIQEKMPLFDTHKFWPPRRPEDPKFWDEPTGMIDGAIFTPLAGYVTDPGLSCHNVQRAAEAHGAEFRFNSAVTGVRTEGHRVKGITLSGGEAIDAPIVINVAGPHSLIINRMAGVEGDMNIKTKAMRQEVCHVPSPAGFDYEKDGCIASDGDIGCYSRPEVGNHILIGSEDPECDTLEFVDPDNYNQELTEGQWKAQVYRMAKRVPGLAIPNQMQGIVDLYDASDDWIPIYDKTMLDGYYMAIGTSGNQYKNAPVIGKMMTELIARCEAGHDHDADPIHYKMEITGRTINLAFYSRKREINPESSFSVIG